MTLQMRFGHILDVVVFRLRYNLFTTTEVILFFVIGLLLITGACWITMEAMSFAEAIRVRVVSGIR